MKIINNNNNNRISFKSFSSHLQEDMRTPICDAFAQRITQLKERYAHNNSVRVLVYDIFSSDIVRVGYAERIIGGSVTPGEFLTVPGFKHSKFMIRTPADSDGAEFESKIIDLAEELSPQCVPQAARVSFALWSNW